MNLLRRWLCKAGFHRWLYFRMANEFIAACPWHYAVSRRCLRCDRMECTDDGTEWKPRL